MEATSRSNLVFDPIYGFIKLTPTEWEIIHTPFFQRLRWIKQLGFSFYVFPGAEHSRFGHSIGAMYNAQKILESCNIAVSDMDLMNSDIRTPDAIFHKSLRLAALMHDLGTFCFSHTTEAAFKAFASTNNSDSSRQDDHEHLGAFIIKNTNFDGGITRILEKNGFDPQVISNLVKGVDPSIIANQILHSEIDCDRMDYLLRDSHYTGLKYGSYDRDYLLHHFQASTIGNQKILTVKYNALHCVEDFLISRYAWYSQVIRSPRGARYDAIAERICYYFLEKNYIYKFSDLLDMVANDPIKFYGFNDNYFINLVHHHFHSGSLDKDLDIKDMAHSLLLQKGSRLIRCNDLMPKLLNPDDSKVHDKVIKRAEAKVSEIISFLQKKGDEKDWVISDLPKKDIIFVKSDNKIVKTSSGPNILLERDPVKISFDNGDVKLLAQVDNSIISRLKNCKNYLPNVFCSDSAYSLLEKANLL
ncbi:MAG: HD domain-containing protein [Bdellovibrionales bacterium]|nr:HD domain-containing protein [Bdellovibrionales bacterium]